MSSVWCFQCVNEYNDDVAECPECGAPTTDREPEAPEQVGTEDEEQLAYELHEWSMQGRSSLHNLLNGADVAHAWQGATLIVREADEEEVDALVREAEIATMPTLDGSRPTMTYELDEFADAARSRISELLGAASLAHEFDAKGDLIVYEADEEAVDDLFEQLDDEPEDEITFGPGVPGVDAHTVVGELFLTSGKLRKNASDHKAIIKFADASDLVEQLALPFGYTAESWSEVLRRTFDLHGALVSEEPGTDDEVRELAAALNEHLRSLV